jgi:hypothetical protein
MMMEFYHVIRYLNKTFLVKDKVSTIETTHDVQIRS